MHERRATARAAERGMTLIEIMIVVAIIGLVVGGVSIIAFASFERAKLEQAKRDAKQIKGAVEIYMAQHVGEPMPESLRMLVDGHYISKITDPWARAYQLKCPGEHAPHSCDVWSLGKDGKGGEGVLGSWMK